jgi:hypothetical protein
MKLDNESIQFTCKVGHRENKNGTAVWSNSTEFTHLLIRTTDNKESAIKEALYQFEKRLREIL